MFTRKQMKEAAKLNFKRKWVTSIIATLIVMLPSFTITAEYTYNRFSEDFLPFNLNSSLFSLQASQFFNKPRITFSLAFAFISAAITFVIIPVAQVGYNRYFLKLRGQLEPKATEPYTPFREENWGNIVFVTLLTRISIFMWSLLFVIPGIIKAFQYSLVSVILASDSTISLSNAKRLSKRLMKGHKLELFVLYLSFIGWFILSVFTGGILQIIYVQPYLQATIIEFYSCRRAELINKGTLLPQELPAFGSDWYSPKNPNGPFQSGSQYGTGYYGQTPNHNFDFPNQDDTQF